MTFALWFTSTRYGPQPVYGWFIAPGIDDVLSTITFLIFWAVLLSAARRMISYRILPWIDLATLGGSIVIFDLFWRFYLSPHAFDAFKLTGIFIGAATPAIIALGIAVIFREFRSTLKPLPGPD